MLLEKIKQLLRDNDVDEHVITVVEHTVNFEYSKLSQLLPHYTEELNDILDKELGRK